jgi:hypothetical protein
MNATFLAGKKQSLKTSFEHEAMKSTFLADKKIF